MTAWEFNCNLAEKIRASLKDYEGMHVGFDEYAGTTKDFINAAEACGLEVYGINGDVVAVMKA